MKRYAEATNEQKDGTEQRGSDHGHTPPLKGGAVDDTLAIFRCRPYETVSSFTEGVPKGIASPLETKTAACKHTWRNTAPQNATTPAERIQLIPFPNEV